MATFVDCLEVETGGGTASVLPGHKEELEAIATMVDGVRRGLGGALVLRGDVGIATSAFLERVIEPAADLEVARVAGVASEMGLRFAGIHQLVAPYLLGLERLPEPQRDALGTALGLWERGLPERFLVGLAVLALLAEAARERPLLCVVDAFQWLDPESADVLAFAARRLRERIGFLIAVDRASEAGRLAALPELRLRESAPHLWERAPSPAPAGVRVVPDEARCADLVRVLIVDDHRLMADGLRLLFDNHEDLEVVGIAADAEEGLRLAATTTPDVLLVDSRLPDASGAELAARVRERQPEVRVLMLGMVASRPLLQEAVRAGARAYLVETQPGEELVDAVRRTAAGEMLIPAATLAELVAGPDDGPLLLDRLTVREQEVLRLLAEGLDNRDIAARLGIGYVTVRSHLRNLSSKLDAHSKLEVLVRAGELGLV